MGLSEAAVDMEVGVLQKTSQRVQGRPKERAEMGKVRRSAPNMCSWSLREIIERL